jgi:hypothetical protein
MAKDAKPGKENINFSPEIHVHIPPEAFAQRSRVDEIHAEEVVRLKHFASAGNELADAALRRMGFVRVDSREQPLRDRSLFRDDNRPNPDHETRRTLHPGKGGAMDAPYGERGQTPSTEGPKANRDPFKELEGSFGKLNSMMDERKQASRRHEEREVQGLSFEMDMGREKLRLRTASWNDYLRCRLQYDIIYFASAGILAAWFGWNTDLNNVFYTIAGAGMLRGLLFGIAGR